MVVLEIAKLSKLRTCNVFPLQTHHGEIPASSTTLTPVRPSSSSSGSTKSNTDSLLVKSLSRDSLSNYPDSEAMLEQILGNVRIMRLTLTELEHLLAWSASDSSTSTEGLTDHTDDEGTH